MPFRVVAPWDGPAIDGVDFLIFGPLALLFIWRQSRMKPYAGPVPPIIPPAPLIPPQLLRPPDIDFPDWRWN